MRIMITLIAQYVNVRCEHFISQVLTSLTRAPRNRKQENSFSS